MNGLRRGYRRPELSGYYRELFINKYVKRRAKRDALGTIHWLKDDDVQTKKLPREPIDPSIRLLILLLVVIICFALAILCALPIRLLLG